MVIWNIFYFSNIGNHNPNWLSYFSEGVETTNQEATTTTICGMNDLQETIDSPMKIMGFSGFNVPNKTNPLNPGIFSIVRIYHETIYHIPFIIRITITIYAIFMVTMKVAV